MKKILAFVFIAMMFISTVALGEEDIDLASMTLEELISLRDSTVDEIHARLGFSFENSEIGAGYYVVGEDIKAGKYEFICTSSETRARRSGDEVEYLGTIWILNGSDENAEKLHEFGEIRVGEKYKFDLAEGQMLVIGRCNGMIQEYDHSWAP